MPAKGFLSLEQKQHLQKFFKQSDHFCCERASFDTVVDE